MPDSYTPIPSNPEKRREHCLKQAANLELAAEHKTNVETKDLYLRLAKSLRELAEARPAAV